jgi:6-phosphogluconolactonase/glucosamine-6-phosphate isomerase/deaminase
MPSSYYQISDVIDYLMSVDTKVLNVGLTGGRTPSLYIAKLVEKLLIKYDHLNLYILDDRMVDKGDDRSNFGMIERCIPIVMWDRISVYGTDEFSKIDGCLHASLLGFGLDGHVLGLFKNVRYEVYDENVVISLEQVAGVYRMSLTLSALRKNCSFNYLIAEKSKWEALETHKLDYVYDELGNVLKVCLG